ncbi:hypothetical protein [Streptomyces sp. NBC_01089]|uniref:hypothetical protein n=1 Tax=Streptomyces sp. NBC_01089 TaxID=2903747 RepID=UPI003865F765|nr:hypothetical protein OG510_20345 [Streptomyces sp. NBC_01089]
MSSRDSDIDFTFSQAVTVRAVHSALAVAGWSLKEPLGISYMVNEDNGYDWQSTNPGLEDEVLTLLDAPEKLTFEVGVCMYHQEAGTGGQFLFRAGRTECAFIPTINRRSLPEAPEFTDLAWYLQALVTPLLPIGLHSYEASDTGF